MSKQRKKRVRSTKKKIEDVPMTPMIDVVFQMLIYFVLTFEIPDRISQMQVWRPSAPVTQPEDKPPPIDLMRVTIYEDAYALNDTRVSLSTLERRFNRLADLNPTQNIIVVATAESPHRNLVAVLNLLSKAGMQNISLLSSS